MNELTAVNKDTLRRVVKWLQQHPAAFNMDTFVDTPEMSKWHDYDTSQPAWDFLREYDPDQYENCQTICCIAGAVVAFAPHDVVEYVRSTSSYTSIGRGAAMILDLPDSIGTRLFYKEEWPSLFWFQKNGDVLTNRDKAIMLIEAIIAERNPWTEDSILQAEAFIKDEATLLEESFETLGSDYDAAFNSGKIVQ